MRTTRSTALLAAALLGSFGLGILRAAPATPASPIPYQCGPCERLVNAFIRADVGPSGTWVLGTTGGDPNTSQDDDKNLLYGFRPGGTSVVGSGYTTIRIALPSGPVDVVPTFAASQTAAADRIETVWLVGSGARVRVTETLRLAQNPFSGRADVATACYDVANQDPGPLDIGLRALLDVKLGQNDGAPYIVPGVGAVTAEREFAGADVPPFWLAFESPTYDPLKLRSVGRLRGEGVTPPDRFLVADWIRIQHAPWDYAVTATQPITRDSAVALYWDPRPLAPGAVRSMCTGYGVAGDRGGSAFLSAPVESQCGGTFAAAVFVNNFEPTALTGGQATIALAAGLSLASGEPATKAIGTVAPGGTGSAVWQVRAAGATSGDRRIDTTVTFDGGRRFTAESIVRLACAAPTPTPTAPPPTARPSATPTPTPADTATPLPTSPPPPTPTDAGACTFILNRVPPAVIAQALANPASVRGWGELQNPSAPPSPFNRLRTSLSLQNIAAPYHPLGNTLVYKAGCP